MTVTVQTDAAEPSNDTSSVEKRRGFVARWARISQHAAAARTRSVLFKVAVLIAVIYNVIGLLDIYSTIAGLNTNNAREANPLMRAAMEHISYGWIVVKLVLQMTVTVMILWFPHRLVLAIFSVSMTLNAIAVFRNLQIAGIF